MSQHVLIAEDHDLVNMGYKVMLEIYFPDFRYETVYSVDELEDALNQKGNDFTLGILDLQLESV